MGEELGERWHSFRRTVLTAAVAALATVAAVAIGTTGASADSSNTTSWVPGEANAVAQALMVAPTTGGLGYNVVLGTSIADYQVSEGQAESQTFNGGAIVLALTTTQCDGTAPLVTQGQLPQPAIAETSGGGAPSQTDSINQQYASGEIPEAALGSEHAAVTDQPTASAVTKSADIDIPGVLEISGVQSSAYAQQLVGQLRQATTTSDVGELNIANVVDLKGLHFEDTQETGPTGAVTEAAASFSVGSATVDGQPQSVAANQLATLFQVANTALAGSGFHIDLPTTSTLSDGQLNLNPLEIGIDNSALGQEVAGPVVGDVQPVRTELDDILLNDISCKLGTPLTVGDIGIGVLSGGGNLDIDLGDLASESDGNSYANPFACLANCTAPSLGAVSPSLSTNVTQPPASTPASFTPGTPGTPGTAGTSASPPKQALGKVTRTVQCLSTSLAGHIGCSNGDAVPVGLIGLAAVLGVGGADYIRLRRYRQVVPEEVAP